MYVREYLKKSFYVAYALVQNYDRVFYIFMWHRFIDGITLSRLPSFKQFHRFFISLEKLV